MPPARMPSSVPSARSKTPRRRRNSIVEAGGNFGARPNPPHCGSYCARSTRSASPKSASVSGSPEGVVRPLRCSDSTSARACSATSARRSRYASRDRCEELSERRQAVPRLRRVVRAAEERLAVGRQEHRHRPAALPGERLHRLHVDGVDVRPLLPVDLDADEQLVHQLGRRVVLERLALHHVAPVARGVADREEDRLVLGAGAVERLVAPGVPVDRVLRVLEEVRARLLREAVHRRRR